MQIIHEIGVIHGRFQPFHLHHLRYALAAKKQCKHLIIGITNPDPSLVEEDVADLNRSQKSSNPLSYYERMSIIDVSLQDSGIDKKNYSIVPFPINRPELIKNYAPNNAIFFMTIYDDWGEKKLKILRKLGFQVIVLWKKKIEDKGICASDIRLNIVNGTEWESLVNRKAAELILSSNLHKKFGDTNNNMEDI